MEGRKQASQSNEAWKRSHSWKCHNEAYCFVSEHMLTWIKSTLIIVLMTQIQPQLPLRFSLSLRTIWNYFYLPFPGTGWISHSYSSMNGSSLLEGFEQLTAVYLLEFTRKSVGFREWVLNITSLPSAKVEAFVLAHELQHRVKVWHSVSAPYFPTELNQKTNCNRK